MPIPKTRAELVAQLDTSYGKLRSEIEQGGPRLGSMHCIDDWTVKELLAVRTWWTEKVVAWVVEWRKGGSPVTPAPGYRWKETPRLNNDIAKRARRESYASVLATQVASQSCRSRCGVWACGDVASLNHDRFDRYVFPRS